MKIFLPSKKTPNLKTSLLLLFSSLMSSNRKLMKIVQLAKMTKTKKAKNESPSRVKNLPLNAMCAESCSLLVLQNSITKSSSRREKGATYQTSKADRGSQMKSVFKGGRPRKSRPDLKKNKREKLLN